MLNLKRVLLEKRIGMKACARILGISEKTFYNKVSGATDFTYKEILELRSLLPEYNIDYLLTEEGGTNE